jgi:uncharacterized radical SAM protein YgiQ
MTDYLPTTREEVEQKGWDRLDFVLITGDAYVDHPSFGAALIGRLLESRGYHVGIISQPDWRDVASFRVLGRPRLGFLITSGNVDSMVNHYSAARHRRKTDAYSPGGKTGLRPNRALLVYASCAKQAYKKVPVILGGLEASLRRFSHYDYWSDKVRRSVLVDSKADLIVYGMGERAVLEIAERLDAGEEIGSITTVRGTSYRCSLEALPDVGPGEVVELPSFETVKQDRRAYAAAFNQSYRNTDPFSAKTVVEPYDNQYVVQNPPSYPLESEELDELYELPYTRNAHPKYAGLGGVPAEEEVKFSLVSSRGCFGGCSFCSLTFHQGRIVQSRSHESLIREAETLARHPEFKGYIHDVGGPTANFRHPACRKQLSAGACSDKQCLYPDFCGNLEVDHSDYLSLLRKLRSLDGVKKVFVRSGIRFDYLMADSDDTFLRELCEHHISGQLKVAPEHVSENVLAYMGKPSGKWYDAFTRKYKRINREFGKKQYLVPYFISSHPGSTLEDAVELAEYLRDSGFIPRQVQDFYPTPGTLATCMYHTGIDPRSGRRGGEHVYVAKGLHDKALQRALIQYRNPANYKLVKEALLRVGRKDLIGFDKKSLIRPGKGSPGKRKKR